MDGFAFHKANSAQEAVDMWYSLDTPRYIAGGTDLLPNLKHRIVSPSNLIGISSALPVGWHESESEIVIGAGTKLSDLSQFDPCPALGQAASLVASPQIRNMATLGGNILLDTRCLFYNQSEFWRRSLGYCLKAEGDWCHVIGSPKTCVATQSSDTVPVLLTLNASIQVIGRTGPREILLRDLYRFNGMDHLKLEPGDLLTEVRIPKPKQGHRSIYRKVRTRGSIDFPQLGIAISGTFRHSSDTVVADSLDIVIGAINPQPRPIRKIEPFFGVALTDATIDSIAQLVHKQTRPVASVHGETAWRRKMAEIHTRRALLTLRDDSLSL